MDTRAETPMKAGMGLGGAGWAVQCWFDQPGAMPRSSLPGGGVGGGGKGGAEREAAGPLLCALQHDRASEGATPLLDEVLSRLSSKPSQMGSKTDQSSLSVLD